MTPRLLEAMRRAGRARRQLEAHECEVQAAQTAAREAGEAVSRATDVLAPDTTELVEKLTQAQGRLRHARTALEIAYEQFHEKNDSLAIAVFAEHGLDPTAEDVTAAMKTTLTVLKGGKQR